MATILILAVLVYVFMTHRSFNRRIERLECEIGLPAVEAEIFTEIVGRMRVDESRHLELHTSLISGGNIDI